MNISEIKLVNFENMVIKEAEDKRDAILNEILQEKQNKLAVIEKEIQDDAKQTLKKAKAKISKEKNERIVQKNLMYKQEMLSERQRLIDNVFNGVIKRLNEFINSQEYEKYLLDTIILSKQKLQGASIVVISKNDDKYAEKISDLGFTVEYTDDIIIGGCLLIDKDNSLRIDETFATKLQSAKDGFLETYNLKI